MEMAPAIGLVGGGQDRKRAPQPRRPRQPQCTWCGGGGGVPQTWQCALDQIKLAACMYKLNSTVVFGGGVCGAGVAQIALGRSAVPGGQPEHHWLGLGAAVRVLIYIHIAYSLSHTYTR